MKVLFGDRDGGYCTLSRCFAYKHRRGDAVADDIEPNCILITIHDATLNDTSSASTQVKGKTTKRLNRVLIDPVDTKTVCNLSL